MDELIIGKEYYVSDGSLEDAKWYKQEKIPTAIYKGGGKFSFSVNGYPSFWKYWVRAEEEITLEQLEASILKLIEPLAKWAESEEGKALLEKINKENHPWT